MSPGAVIDYYEILSVAPTATQQQVREAYKRAALQSHPDRVSHTDPSRAARTKKFQQVNDAYYTLSDPGRRRDYDATRAYQRANSPLHTPPPPHPGAHWEDAQFSDVFEEMMRDEGFAAAAAGGEATATAPRGGKSLWGIVGGLSGGALGFIVANVPGLVAGAVAGNRLGAVRDAKGKSVYEVFQELPQSDRAKLLSDLASRVLAHAVG
ncbi:DnaJ domain-containing protein [Morchella snyderi]|nr:DnaJ domain-containing protein [Morchella snyderi]